MNESSSPKHSDLTSVFRGDLQQSGMRLSAEAATDVFQLLSTRKFDDEDVQRKLKYYNDVLPQLRALCMAAGCNPGDMIEARLLGEAGADRRAQLYEGGKSRETEGAGMHDAPLRFARFEEFVIGCGIPQTDIANAKKLLRTHLEDYPLLKRYALASSHGYLFLTGKEAEEAIFEILKKDYALTRSSGTFSSSLRGLSDEGLEKLRHSYWCERRAKRNTSEKEQREMQADEQGEDMKGQEVRGENKGKAEKGVSYHGIQHYLFAFGISSGRVSRVARAITSRLLTDPYLCKHSVRKGIGYRYEDTPETNNIIREVLMNERYLEQRVNSIEPTVSRRAGGRGRTYVRRGQELLGQLEPREDVKTSRESGGEMMVPYSALKIESKTGVSASFIELHRGVLGVEERAGGAEVYNSKNLSRLIELWKKKDGTA